jgi:hypothetical protein
MRLQALRVAAQPFSFGGARLCAQHQPQRETTLDGPDGAEVLRLVEDDSAALRGEMRTVGAAQRPLRGGARPGRTLTTLRAAVTAPGPGRRHEAETGPAWKF